MELSLKNLLEFLHEIAPGEISADSLHYLLLLKSYTAKRLFSGKTKSVRERVWHKNACKMIEKVNNDYEETRQAVLKGRSESGLKPSERDNLRKVEDEFEKELAEEYKAAGIFFLQECCYFPDRTMGLIFNRRLAALVEEVLRIAKQFQGITGKECLLNFMRQNNSSPSDIAEVEGMEDNEFDKMTKFLVAQVTPSQDKAQNRKQISAEDVEGLESSAYLLGQHREHVGLWSFLIFTEEQEKLFQDGTLFESALPELVFMPGDYILYVSSISGLVNNGLTKPQDFQELVDALFRKLLSFAKKGIGIYFKKLCINISNPVFECLYRNMGFHFTVEDFQSGHIYVQSLIPFPSTFKTKEPALLSELKKMYDEHFGGLKVSQELHTADQSQPQK